MDNDLLKIIRSSVRTLAMLILSIVSAVSFLNHPDIGSALFMIILPFISLGMWIKLEMKFSEHIEEE